MKIIVLAENTAKDNTVESEHGLSLYIETEQHKILFDMGQSDLFVRNADKLCVDLTEVDIAILSHGHYDHGGGLAHFLDINKKAPVYINEKAFGAYYNGTDKYIGLNQDLKNHPRIIFTTDFQQIDKGVSLHTCNTQCQKFNLGSFGLNKTENGEMLPDDFLHEQYLLLEEQGNTVLISGCSHKGILNIAEWFSPNVLVGGFHFSKLPTDNLLRGYAETLSSFVCRFYTCHCTGVPQYEFMKEFMPKLHYISTGEIVII